jgi:hypothetical protein
LHDGPPVQSGWQTHRPSSQVPKVQAGVQHVGWQVPFSQIWPAGQVTPAQRFGRHWMPPSPNGTQKSLLGHAPPSTEHGFGVTQSRSQVVPVGHRSPQLLTVRQAPLLQYVPVGQEMLEQADGGKQPGMHCPLTQVWLAGQVTPVQGSAVTTQDVTQVCPGAQVVAVHWSG